MVTMNLNIGGIEARSRDEPQAAVNSLVIETLSGPSASNSTTWWRPATGSSP
jgi:hypothetical protein